MGFCFELDNDNHEFEKMHYSFIFSMQEALLSQKKKD